MRSLGPEPWLPGPGRPLAPLTRSGRLPLTQSLSQPLWDKTDGPPAGPMLSQGCRWDVRQEPLPPLWAGAWHPAHCGLQLTVRCSSRLITRSGTAAPSAQRNAPWPPGSGLEPWWGSEVIVVAASYTDHPLNSDPVQCRNRVSPLSTAENLIPSRVSLLGPRGFSVAALGAELRQAPGIPSPC